MAIRKLSGSQLRAFRSKVAKLKDLGLVSKRVDARSQKPTRYMQETVNKRFAGVLSGKDKVVHTPRKKDADQFKARFDVKGKSVVIPGSAKSETNFRYDPKSHEIRSTVKQGSKTVRKAYSPKPIGGVEDLPSGRGVLYTIRFGKNGGQFSFDTKEGLANFLRSLSDSGWKTAINYVEVTRGHTVTDLEDFADEFDDDDDPLSDLARDARDAER